MNTRLQLLIQYFLHPCVIQNHPGADASTHDGYYNVVPPVFDWFERLSSVVQAEESVEKVSEYCENWTFLVYFENK